MTAIEIRAFEASDIPQIMELQRAYQQTYPHAIVIPGEVYLSPGFEQGQNVFCAFDEQGCLQGYAPVMPVLTEQPEAQHTIWTEIKVRPDLPAWRQLKDELFERVVTRARVLAARLPGHGAKLSFQYHPSEMASIEFVLASGCLFTESVFRMLCELTQEPPVLAPPEGIQVRRWHMDSEPEQQAYVQARNEAFSADPVTLGDWQHFLGSPEWQQGTSVTAFDGEQVVGSVAAYPDSNASELIGRKAGATEYIFVRPAWRRGGIAACLIAEALRYLKEIGLEVAYLGVSAANEDALGLYRRLGYRVVEETRLYVLAL